MTGTPAHWRDRTLVRAIVEMRAQGRDAEARWRYGELVGCHQRRACRIAYRLLGDAADADDAVQDAFVKAYMNLSSFSQNLPFEAWFTRILTNQCRDRIRARRRRERWVISASMPNDGRRDYFETVAAAVASPEDRLLTRERRSRLADALLRLPPSQRSLVILSHVEGFSSPQLSAVTGMHPSTIRVRLFRALRKLRALLADGDGDAARSASVATIRAPQSDKEVCNAHRT